MKSSRRCCLFAFILSLALGCGSGETVGSGFSGAAAASGDGGQLSGVVATNEIFKGDFDGMAERRVIRILTTFNRTNYFLIGGEPRGAMAEGARMFEEFVNERLGTGKLKVYVAVIPVKRDELLQALVEGRGDIAAANLTVTARRQETVDFGAPFLTGVKQVVVTGPSSPPLSGVDDLAGKEIWVRPSSSFQDSLATLSETLEAAGKPPIDIRAAPELLETEDLMQMVASGMLPLTVADSHLADFWGDVLDGAAVRNDLAISEGDSIAWAFRKNSPELVVIVNEFVAKHKKGTLLGNVILKRYLQDNEWVRNPMKHANRLEEHQQSFEKWAGEYGIEWLLTAAQGYQESQLDQSRRSSAGAVGVMQIKPSTAADPNVGINDVSTADANIQAGIKYLKFVRDRYYREEGMTELNQALFALAAYNAGPARVNGLRRQAIDKGLDPNVWFREVEQLAPRETVQYVSNIFKYYISYVEYVRQQGLKEEVLQ